MKSKIHDKLVSTLAARFDKSKHRHPGILWTHVLERLLGQKSALESLAEMEKTGGEPDVVGYDQGSKEFLFVDCSKESPLGRRSCCYDREALQSRKQNKPKASALEMADSMGIQLLTEAEYRDIQKGEAFDTKTSSWIETPADIRRRGGALFCDRRYEAVFVYHNGAESYYAARGFRGILRV
jgi:hypothetical protein